MAHRPQHTLQIMETQTRFDLSTAIANWQQELARQPDLTPLVRRELETHLRDTIAELQHRGLNDEESFWLARRRTGQPEQLDEEFAKTDPAHAWRERAFWVVIGLLFVNFWGTLVALLFTRSGPTPYWETVKDFLPGWVSFYLPIWLRDMKTIYVSQAFLSMLQAAPVFLLAILLGNRRLKFGYSILNFISFSRTRVVWVMTIAFLCVRSYAVFKYGVSLIAFQIPWVFSLIALAAWLIPAKKETAAKPA